jgi:ferredoxin--NADP+ reductase
MLAESAMPKWREGTIVDKTIWTNGLFTIRVNVPGVEPFLPGQFLQLGVYPDSDERDSDEKDCDDGDCGERDGDERDGGDQDSKKASEIAEEAKLINRPYSVASPHSDYLEFFIVLVEDGELTPRLWRLENGDKLQVSERAAGSFTLKKTPPAENLWLLATGTGLAPYIAMLRTPEPWEKFKNIVVVHGVRHHADLAYTDELKAIEKEKPENFKFVQALTREEAPGTLSGRIPNLIERGSLEATVGFKIQATDSSVLLCGNPAMLDSMEELLGERGMKRHRSKSPGQIVLERYW